MQFSWNWNASFFKEFAVKAGSFTHRSVHKTMRASLPLRQRLSIDVPLGALRVTGCEGTQAELEIRVRSRTREDAEGVTYTTHERDGAMHITIDGPPGRAVTFASVEVDLRVPRSMPLVAHCALGKLQATDVGPIEAHASLGAVEIVRALSTCVVSANLGAVDVSLSPQWRGERVDVSTNLGQATLRVPANVRLKCSASSDLGKAEIAVGSYPDAPPATVHSNLGHARIV